MKHLFNAAIDCKKKTIAMHFLNRFRWNVTSPFYLMILSGTFLLTGCNKYDINEPKIEPPSLGNKEMNADMESIANSSQTSWELQQARAATAKYKHISKAFADGYADINFVMPNMGYHYMKSMFVDSVFEIRKPELLVYNKDEDGNFELVSVEYAVPINPLKPYTPPAGFTGKADVWDRNTDFGLWTLHAWVWKYNPDGVFNPTNPLVHVL